MNCVAIFSRKYPVAWNRNPSGLKTDQAQTVQRAIKLVIHVQSIMKEHIRFLGVELKATSIRSFPNIVREPREGFGFALS